MACRLHCTSSPTGGGDSQQPAVFKSETADLLQFTSKRQRICRQSCSNYKNSLVKLTIVDRAQMDLQLHLNNLRPNAAALF